MKIKRSLILSFLLLTSFSLLQAQTEANLTLNTASGNTLNSDEKAIDYRLSGMYNVTTIGVLSGSSQNRHSAPLSFLSLMMYPLNDHTAFGAGMGVEFLEETYLPLVADFRYYIRGSRFSPFVFVQSGYNLPTDKEANQYIIDDHYSIWPGPYPQPQDVKPLGGFIINPGFGIRHMFHPDFGLEISFSYRYQKLGYESQSDSRLEVDYNRLNIRIGILFQ